MIELLPKLMRGVTAHEHNYLSRGKITLPQLWVLEHLSRHKGGCPMNILARSLKISRPAATGLIDRLIAQGLVRRGGDKADRRVVQVAMTARGKTILSNIWEQKRKTILKVFGQISAQERGQYIAILGKVVAQLTQPKGES